MSTAEKVECPICGKYFSKLGANAHVNSCLNATENDFETPMQDRMPSETLSPPKKISRLEASDGFSSQPAGQISSKRESDASQFDSKQGFTTSITDGATINLQPAQNAFDKLWKRSPQSTAKNPSGTAVSPQKRKMMMSPDKPTQGPRSSSSRSSSDKQQVHVQNTTSTVTTVTGGSVLATSSHGNTRRTPSHIPLAERMRPLTLEGYIGQEHVIGQNKMLRRLLVANNIPSMILWGPPGCGKTTLARIISAGSRESGGAHFVTLSATTAGIADVKEVIKVAKNDYKMFKRKTILFVDEIHRFNKLQQDTFLPHVEDGTIVLIGATTENPSFQVISALLSRCKVVVLEKLTAQHLEQILTKAALELNLVISEETDTAPSRLGLSVEKAALQCLAGFCDGDARMALNSLQIAINSKKEASNHGNSVSAGSIVSVHDIKESLQRSHVHYDMKGEEHYNCASALIKSIRGSDDNAAIYWMSRMLEGGEDPLFIARRLVVAASEDIGLADPQALPLAMSCFQACNVIGKPESAINLAHCTTYLARAPKSNESYMAMRRARENIKNYAGPLPGVPLHLRNAPTKLMKNLGYGAGYKYSHDYRREDEDQRYLPHELGNTNFFHHNNNLPEDESHTK